MDLKYNFICFIYDVDYYKLAYSDFKKMEGVQCIESIKPKGKIQSLLFKFHVSRIINSIVDLPFKQVWLNNTIKLKKDYSNLPYCFIFFSNLLEKKYVRDYIIKLHEIYPDAKFVCYYSDLIESSKWFMEKTPEKLQLLFDLFISYDHKEAAKYNINYYPTTYSNIKYDADEKTSTCDVFFLANAKDRLSKIYEVYNILTSNGLICEFYLTNVSTKEQIALQGVHFIDKMSYIDNLKHIQKCKAILEIEQNGATGPTLRTWESINFGKLLVTDNSSIVKTPFYDERFISIFSSAQSININQIKEYTSQVNPKEKLIRPINFLQYIQENL